MLRKLDGAIGPVVATAVMATYTAPLLEEGQPVPGELLPSATAFNVVFGIGLVLTVIALVAGRGQQELHLQRREKGDATCRTSVTYSPIQGQLRLSSVLLRLTEDANLESAIYPWRDECLRSTIGF